VPVRCDICGNPITDFDKLPVYLTITGWDIDEGQANLEVCRHCLLNRPKDILEKLEGEEYE